MGEKIHLQYYIVFIDTVSLSHLFTGWKKSNKWTRTFQTRLAQGSVVVGA